LAKIGPRAIDGLLKLVDDPDSATATAAVRSLGMMGHAGKDAVPRLLEIGNRSNSVVLRGWISNTLVSLDPLGSLSGIRDRMKDERPNVRLFAIETISDVARLRLDRLSVPKPDEVVDDLIGLLGDPDTDVRRAASFALCKIDLPVDTPLAPLEGALRDSDDEVREHASFALRLLKSAKARAAAESTQSQLQP
jgi:HEAT repeat protein